MIVELSDFFNNPSIVEIGPIKVQYYAVTWLMSAIFIYLYLRNHEIIKNFGFSFDKTSDLVFTYGLFFGAFAGGRVGYMLFYGTDQLLNDPLSLFYIWQGGLSFHGGLAGVAISVFIFSKKFNISFFRLTDAVTLATPISLGLVRIGNFLNGELYGNPTSGNWGFIFPTDAFGLPRHPSQLYESFFEGIVLFMILFFINKNTKITGVVSAAFLIFYGTIRFFIEFYRQPDAHIGYVALEWLSMGQLLCLPMILAGLLLLTYFLRKA